MSSFQPRTYSEQGDVKDLLKMIGDLKGQLESRKQACVKLKTENQRLEKEKKDLEKQLLAFQTGRGSTSTVGASAKQRALQRAVKEQQRSLQATSLEKAKASQEMGSVQSRLEQLTEQCQTLESDMDAVRAERDRAREEAEELRDKLARDVQKRQKKMDTMRAEVQEEAQASTRQLQRALEEAQAECGRLQAEAATEKDSLRRQLQETQAQAEAKEKQLSGAASRLSEFEREPESTGWQVVRLPLQGKPEETSEGSGAGDISLSSGSCLNCLELHVQEFSPGRAAWDCFLVVSVQQAGRSLEWNSSMLPSAAKTAVVAELRTKFLLELPGSLEVMKWINDPASSLDLKLHSASTALLGFWQEGTSRTSQRPVVAAILTTHPASGCLGVALYQLDDQSGRLGKSLGMLTLDSCQVEGPIDLNHGEVLMDPASLGGDRLEGLRSSGLFEVSLRKVRLAGGGGAEVWRVVEALEQRRLAVQQGGLGSSQLAVELPADPIAGAGPIGTASLPMDIASKTPPTSSYPQQAGTRPGASGLAPSHTGALAEPGGERRGPGAGSVKATLRFTFPVTANVSLLNELGKQTGGGDVAEELQASRQLTAQITRQAIHIEDALAGLGQAVEEALTALLCSTDPEELPAHVESAVQVALSKLQETEALLDLRLGNCNSLIQERHATALSGQQPLPTTARLSCAQQLDALQRVINTSLISAEEQAHCSLDSALYAAHGLASGSGKALAPSYSRFAELCSTLTDTRQRMAKAAASQVSAMQDVLQIGAACGAAPADGCLSEAVEHMLSPWAVAAGHAGEKIASAMEGTRRKVEDASQANAASKELQQLLADEALSMAAVLHIHRSAIMRAGIQEGRRSGVLALKEGMQKFISQMELSAGPWLRATQKSPPASAASAQAWQSVSYRARRTSAAASARCQGHLGDMAADALLLCGGRAEAVEVVLHAAKDVLVSVFGEAGNELKGLQAKGSPLAGTEEAEFEAKAVVSALRSDVAEVLASTERRAMQAVMTPLWRLEQCSTAASVTPARMISTLSLDQHLLAVHPRRGRDVAGDGAIVLEALEESPLYISRSALARNLFLALDPKPYQGSTATPEQKAEEERNKKVLQWVRRVAAQLNWEVRNVKDIQRLADDGIDEHGLMELFDVILQLEGDSGSDETAGIVEALELCGVPVEQISLDMVDSSREEAAFAAKILQRAVEGRMLAPIAGGGQGAVHMPAESRERVERALQDTSARLQEALKTFLSVAQSVEGTTRAAAALEKGTGEGLYSLDRVLTAAMQVSATAVDLPPLKGSADTLPVASITAMPPLLPSGTVTVVKPTRAGRGGRYAASAASTLSEVEEAGVRNTGRHTAFVDDDDDETVTQSYM
eukprot:CAMPEP_0117659562 /NCGR_PEP_ID=MMETSP0804-20121206/6499_1 /TAXON_ID=1074897 /ORGANISM="Tetraselmis astigmatica, Strain CCMP880" /LENGTH=1370 /DNA_ID=CAMNT_0005466229 /DNA_START=14 /DNA_END=4124 /DNA_ORIENTATION=-